MKKARFFLDIEEKYKNIKSKEILLIITNFLNNLPQKICFNIENIPNAKWHRKYIFLDEEGLKIWKKFQKVAKENKISPKTLVRILIKQNFN
jgi:hypothetical protein